MPQSTIYLAESADDSRPRTPPAVATLGLARLFAGSPALVDVSLQLDAGRMLALVGSNGAGKTTLLRLMATAIRPSFGELALLGFDAVRYPAAVRPSIAYLSHATGLYDDLTLRENLRFAAEMRRLPRREAARRVDASTERVGLAPFSGERVRTFSAGMRKRTALARLLLADPRLVLLDEPYAALDEDGAGLVDELLDEWRSRGVTCVVASHAAERLIATADAVARLDAGTLVELRGQGAARLSRATAPGARPAAQGAGM